MEDSLVWAKAMQPPEERQARSQLRQLLNEHGLLQASLFRRRLTCGKDYCRCAKSKANHHICWYVSFSRKGRLQMKCIPEEWVEPIREWIARYREMEVLLQKISRLYWDRLKRSRR